ncbi:hypothetical protein FVE85_0037 [Porphyridium purpureum]|uniref:Transmembrane protein n=1 Tax=Porphyridium purpureum TaxID=35688 RepID=A0A5J4YYW3_PORPP|nr:hypothetical protein FVE85_0037 [Porphyridium purpureum]|eukprot:POR7038..scf208_2
MGHGHWCHWCVAAALAVPRRHGMVSFLGFGARREQAGSIDKSGDGFPAARPPREVPAGDHASTRFGIGGSRSDVPQYDHVSPGIPPELFPYGLPQPPRSFLIAGIGWGYGLGCSLGPFYGTGVGFGWPGGVVLGAGAGIGAVCGAGFGGGALAGNGNAYLPFGLMRSFFFAPKVLWAERAIERWRIENERRIHLRRVQRYKRGGLSSSQRFWAAVAQQLSRFNTKLVQSGADLDAKHRQRQTAETHRPGTDSERVDDEASAVLPAPPPAHLSTAESQRMLMHKIQALQLENEALRQKLLSPAHQ